MPTDDTPDFTRKDAKMLRWFFGPGLCFSESSATGVIFDRADLFSTGSKKCPSCRGKAWVKKWVYVCTHCSDGWSKDKLGPCGHCGGKRLIEAKIPETVRDKLRWISDACMRCRGTGLVPRASHARRKGELTVNVSTEEIHDVPSDPYSKELRWHGTVMRRLPLLEQVHVLVLYAYWGVGDAYSTRNELGRIWPVLALTEKGRDIIKRWRFQRPEALGPYIDDWYDPEYPDWLKAWTDLTQPELLEQLTKMPPRLIRKSEWEIARVQAERLVSKAAEEWYAIGQSLEMPRPIERKPKAIENHQVREVASMKVHTKRVIEVA